MKGIRRRGDSFLVDVTRNGRRLTATVSTQKEAVAKRLELLNALVNGSGREVGHKKAGGVWSLGQAFDYVCETHWKGTKGERSAIANAQAFGEPVGTILSTGPDHHGGGRRVHRGPEAR